MANVNLTPPEQTNEENFMPSPSPWQPNKGKAETLPSVNVPEPLEEPTKGKPLPPETGIDTKPIPEIPTEGVDGGVIEQKQRHTTRMERMEEILGTNSMTANQGDALSFEMD